MKHTGDELKKILRENEVKQTELSKEITALIDQETHALDRYHFYKESGDLVKQLYWEELADYCETLYLGKQRTREELRETERDQRHELIQILQKEIDEIFNRINPSRYASNKDTN